LIAAAGALVFLVLGLLLWLLRPGESTTSSQTDADVSQPLDITRESVPVRSQLATTGRDLSQPVAADPGPWAVMPDSVSPATGLRSVFAWPENDPALLPAVVLFGRPDAARAAILAPGPDPSVCHLYDLRAVDPIKRIALVDPDANNAYGKIVHLLADLSPGGDRLALQRSTIDPFSRFANRSRGRDDPRGLPPTATPFRLQVYSADGKPPTRVDLATPATWLGLIDDQRLLLLLSDGQLRLHDLATGQTSYTVNGTYRAPVVLSPGRAWAAAFDGNAFVWIHTNDGKIAGRTPTPTLRTGEFRGDARGAFSFDGKLFATSRTASGAMGMFRCLSVWDVSTGKPLEAGDHQVSGGLPEHLLWCGPRQILLGSTRLIDLDLGLHTGAGSYRLLDGNFAAPTSPDGRFWYLAHAKPPYQPDRLKAVLPALQGSKHLEAVEKTGFVLAAFSLPDEVKTRIATHRNAVTLSKMTVRVEVTADDPTFRRQVGETLADALASIGCRVTPTAISVARLVISPTKSDQVQKLTPGQPGFRVYELVPGKILEAKLDVLDDKGIVRWSVAFDETEPDSTPNPVAAVRRDLTDRLKRILAGRTEAGGAALPPLDTPTNVGIDGLTLPPPP
jgi:hypothetical protein